MKEKVSEAQDHAFYQVGSLGLVAVLLITILIMFAWMMQRPISDQADIDSISGGAGVAGAEIMIEK